MEMDRGPRNKFAPGPLKALGGPGSTIVLVCPCFSNSLNFLIEAEFCDRKRIKVVNVAGFVADKL
jgi:hypothetical protein